MVTGHSLGGALATLCAYDVAHLDWKGGKKAPVVAVTWASPRVGNKAFKESMNEMVASHVRVANKGDIVPTVPKIG